MPTIESKRSHRTSRWLSPSLHPSRLESHFIHEIHANSMGGRLHGLRRNSARHGTIREATCRLICTDTCSPVLAKTFGYAQSDSSQACFRTMRTRRHDPPFADRFPRQLANHPSSTVVAHVARMDTISSTRPSPVPESYCERLHACRPSGQLFFEQPDTAIHAGRQCRPPLLAKR
jgi:hypothetical protein